LRVRAVIEDLPHDTHLRQPLFGQPIFVSTLAPNSVARTLDAKGYKRGDFSLSARTYVRFKSDRDAAAAVAGMDGLVARNMAAPGGRWSVPNFTATLKLIPLDRLHLYPLGGTNFADPHTDPATLWALGGIATLILTMAGINFVNLATARANRRAVEVGVRKAAGAGRRDLIVQFVGEAMLYAVLGLVCAAAMVELALPELNALLDRGMGFQPWRDPALSAALLGLALLLGFAAGLYPAFVLSSFRPAAALKGGIGTGGAAIRSALVGAQFAGLIALVVATGVIALQTRYALKGRLNVAAGQVVLMNLYGAGRTGPPPRYCHDALAQEIRSLPGVTTAACSSLDALDQGLLTWSFRLPHGGEAELADAPVDAGFFELYGVRPLAGRLLTSSPADAAPRGLRSPGRVVINQTAARTIGFASPAAAIGATLTAAPDPDPAPHPFVSRPPITSLIVGVVPDFRFDVLHGAAHPTIYYEDLAYTNGLSIKLNGRDVRSTIAAIDALWKRLGEPRAVQRRFLSEQLDTVYRDVIRQELLIAVLAAVAIVIACLGLFGMAAFTAERRTKEIGVRKVMGASRGDIVRLLLWQFTTPVLWASLIALPVAWWAMDRWLKGFSARIELAPWLFAAAPAAAILIAWGTVLAHTLKVAAEKPAGALRYE
jgi:putative ABC transport system permease protein